MPRRGILGRRRRRKAATEHMRVAARRAREEAHPVAERERELARRAGALPRKAPLEDLVVGLRGIALEARRRLRPLTGPIGSGLARIAPPISRGLFLAVAIPASLLARALDLFLDLSRRLRARLGPLAAGVGVVVAAVAARVTPARTVAAVAALAAVALAASQFVDYRGVAVGAPEYEGEIGTAAPVPLTDLEHTGEAHLYVMVPLAALALLLTWLTLRGRWRLGRAIALIGLAGVAIAVAIDAPKGLDTGLAGQAFIGTEAQLLEGFWAQIAASATLLLCGPLLGWYVKLAGADRGRERHRGRRELRSGAATPGGRRGRFRRRRSAAASGSLGART